VECFLGCAPCPVKHSDDENLPFLAAAFSDLRHSSALRANGLQ